MATAQEVIDAANGLLARAKGFTANLGHETGHGEHYSDSAEFLALARQWEQDYAAYLLLVVE